jgi:hypothetical protein
VTKKRITVPAVLQLEAARPSDERETQASVWREILGERKTKDRLKLEREASD